MKCLSQKKLMHHYLDGDLTKEDEIILRTHLETCEECQNHFHELSRTITMIQSTGQNHSEVSTDFTANVMNNLPKEKSHMRYRRWFRRHPVITSVAVIFLILLGSLLSGWTQEQELVVSKQKDLIIQGDTVIVPENVVLTGDLVVKNGNLEINGTVDGNVTLVNGQLISNQDMMASVGEVTGDLHHIDQVFKRLWYEFKGVFERIIY